MNELKRPSAKRLLAWLLAIVLCVGAIPADAVFAEPADLVTEHQVTFVFSAADGFGYLGEEGGQTVRTVEEGGFITDVQEEYSNGTRNIVGWQDAETRERVSLSQPVTRNMELHPILDKYHAWFSCNKLGYSDLSDVPAGTPLADLVPKLEGKGHYTLEYWYLVGAQDEAFDFDGIKADRDYYFYGKVSWDFDYMVEFQAGDGFGEIETQYLKEGEKPVEPTGLNNGNREIIGWTTEEGGREKYDFNQTVTEDLYLYPIYDKCRVIFYDHEEIYEWRQEAYVTSGEAVMPPAEVKDPFYMFKGWGYYDWDDNHNFVTFDFNTPITEDIVLWSEWEPNFYSVNFYNNLEEEDVPYWHGEVRVFKGQTAAGIRKQVGDPVVKGHYFAGWYYDGACTQPFNENTVLTDDIELYAKWGTNSDGSSVTPGNGNEAKVTSVSLSAASLVIPKGKSQALTAATAPLKNAAVTWSSSDNSVATVNGGTVTAKKAGEATITATAAGGVRASCKVTVAEVKLNAASAELKTKQSSAALKIESKYPKNDTVASWKSSNPKVVKVDKKGKITADKKTGTATITVTMKSGTTAACKVTVKKKAVKTKKLTMNVKKLTMKKGKSVSLSVTRDPITATEKIKWSSSNKKVATVTSNGKVKAKKKGKATITAKSSNGKKAACKITVK